MTNEFELINHLKIKYMNIFLVQLKYRTPHYHNEMEFGLILRGTLIIKKRGISTTLIENDIFILNPGETHELFSQEDDVLILSLQLSSKMFSSYFPSIKALHFSEFSLRQTVSEQKHQEILHYMRTLAFTYFQQEPLFEFQCTIIVNQFVYDLLKNIPYRILTTVEQELLYSRIGRLKRIIDYVEENYNRKLLLQEIADSEQLSLTYLSHFIKDLLGMSFQNYLNHIRFEHAVHLLDTTDQSILDICFESGFSDIRYMNKLFMLRYGCTPKQYRKNNNQKNEAKCQSITTLQRILSSEEALAILLD